MTVFHSQLAGCSAWTVGCHAPGGAPRPDPGSRTQARGPSVGRVRAHRQAGASEGPAFTLLWPGTPAPQGPRVVLPAPTPLQARPGVGGQSDLMTQGFISLRCNLGHLDAGLRDRPCPGPCQAGAAGVALATAEGGRGPGRASGWSPGYGVLGVAAAVPGSAGHTEGLGLHPEGSGSLPLVREGARARRSRVLWQRPRRVRVSDGEQGTLAPSVLFQGMASLALRGGRDLHF